MKKTIIALSVLIFLLSFAAHSPCAEEEDKSISAKAADGLIESMPDFFGDVAAMKSMTDDQKVDYVLTQAENRIKDKISEKFQDDMKGLLIDYAKKSLRAKAFMDVAVPQIRSAITRGEKFNWTDLDKQVQEQADNNFKSAMQAIDAAKFGYEVYKKASDEGMLEAFKAVSAKVYDSLASSYIPGWSYIKMGASLVEALGNYVLNYAKETAIEGMLETMYSIKSDPAGFAQWLYKNSPVMIKKDIDDKWVLVEGGKFVYSGKGTDKGAEEMKKELYDKLTDMRMKIHDQIKEDERKQQELQRQAENQLWAAKSAQWKIEAAAAKTINAADEPLAKIRDFKKKYFGYKKQEATKTIADAERNLEKEKSKALQSAAKYEPIDKGAIISALERALDEIHDSGTEGYNYEKTQYDYKEYQKIRGQIIEASNQKIAQDLAAINKIAAQIRAQYMNPDGSVIRDGYVDAVRPYLGCDYILRNQQGTDLGVLAAEENMSLLKATERSAKLSESVSKGLEEIKTKIGKAVSAFHDGIAILDQEKAAILKYPEAWRNPGYYDQVSRYNWLITLPLDFQKHLRYYEELRDNLMNDEKHMTELHRKEKELYAKYIDSAEDAVGVYKNLVPENLVPKEVGGRIREGKQTGHESIEFILQAPWGFSLPTGTTVIPDMREKAIFIPRLWYLPLTFDEQLSAINKPPITEIAKALSDAKKRVEEMQELAYLGGLTSIYYSVHNHIFSDRISIKTIETSLEQEKQRATDLFPLDGGGDIMRILPEASEGAGYLKQLITFWENNKGNIEKLKNLRKQIGNSLEQYFGLSKNYYPVIDKLDTIPERIKLYEAGLEQAKKDYSRRVDFAEKYLNEAKQEYRQSVSTAYFSSTEKTKQLKELIEKSAHYHTLYKSWAQDARLAKIVEEWGTLTQDLEKTIAEAEKDAKEQRERYTRESQEREKAKQEEDRKQQLAVQDFYRQFREAYESRNDSKVMSFMGDEWGAGDGTTLSDLQTNLRRSFKLFDEIRFNVQNIGIVPSPDGKYTATYDVTITSRIYRRNLKHEEKSSVTEVLAVDASGKVKIVKTIGGRFWYVQ